MLSIYAIEIGFLYRVKAPHNRHSLWHQTAQKMDRKNAQDSSISCWPLFQQKGEGNTYGPSGQSRTELPNRNLPILSFHFQTGKLPSAQCKPKNLIHRSDNLTKFFIWKKINK